MKSIVDPHTIQNACQGARNKADHHGRESHFWFANAAIAFREEICNHIRQVTARQDPQKRANNPGKEAEARLISFKLVIGCECDCKVRRDGHDKTDSDGQNQCCPKDGRKNEQANRTNEHGEEGFCWERSVENTQTLQVCLFARDFWTSRRRSRDLVLKRFFGCINSRSVSGRRVEDEWSVIGSLRQSEDDKDGQGCNQCSCNIVYVSPVVTDCNKTGDDDATRDTTGKSRSV